MSKPYAKFCIDVCVVVHTLLVFETEMRGDRKKLLSLLELELSEDFQRCREKRREIESRPTKCFPKFSLELSRLLNKSMKRSVKALRKKDLSITKPQMSKK